MGRPPALNDVRASFDESIESALNLFNLLKPTALLEPNENGPGGMKSYQARKLMGLAFLQMVVTWEDLVEAVLIRYVAGANAPNGYAPALLNAPPASLLSAYRIVANDPNYNRDVDYLSWTRFGGFIKRAKDFFVNGEPFNHLTSGDRDRLRVATDIRNRVAHSSTKCIEQFKEVARQHLGLPAKTGKLDRGYSVGKLLVTRGTRCFGHSAGSHPFFIHYHRLFVRAADTICPK